VPFLPWLQQKKIMLAQTIKRNKKELALVNNSNWKLQYGA
jgi:hypothetical protein